MDQKLKVIISIIMEFILLIVSITTIVLSMKYEVSVINPMIFITFSQLSIFAFMMIGKKR